MMHVPRLLADAERHMPILRAVILLARQFELVHDGLAYGKEMAHVVHAQQQIWIPLGLEERLSILAVVQLVLIAIQHVRVGMLVDGSRVAEQRIRLQYVIMI